MFKIIDDNAEILFESNSVEEVLDVIRTTSYAERLIRVFVLEDNITYDVRAWIQKFVE